MTDSPTKFDRKDGCPSALGGCPFRILQAAGDSVVLGTLTLVLTPPAPDPPAPPLPRPARPLDDDLADMRERLAAWRQGRNLSMAAFGDLVGVTASTVLRLERGRLRPKLDLVRRISEVTGIVLWRAPVFATALDRQHIAAGIEKRRLLPRRQVRG